MKRPFDRGPGQLHGSYVTEGGQKVEAMRIDSPPDSPDVSALVTRLEEGDFEAVGDSQASIGNGQIIRALAALLEKVTDEQALIVARVLSLSRDRAAAPALQLFWEGRVRRQHPRGSPWHAREGPSVLGCIADVAASLTLQTGDMHYSVETLPALLRAPQPAIRFVAARNMARVLTEPSIGDASLLRIEAQRSLDASDPEVFALFASLPDVIAPKDVRVRCEQMLAAEESIRGCAVRVLCSRMDDPDLLHLLSKHLAVESALHLRCDVAMALARSGIEHERVVAVARDALGEASPLIRYSGAMLLSALPKRFSTDAALVALEDEPDSAIRAVLSQIIG